MADSFQKISEGNLERALLARIHCAGKVFLLGEYSVLAQRPAFITTLGPRFWFEARKEEEPKLARTDLGVAPESPAGRLLQRMQDPLGGTAFSNALFEFDDPFKGAGGFGASTAQFATLYRYFSSISASDLAPSLEGAFRFYRGLFEKNDLPPSGADLAAQWSGGVTWFRGTGALSCEVLPVVGAESVLDRFWIFSATQQAGRKAATHTHLKDLGSRASGLDQLAELSRVELDPIVSRFQLAIESRDLSQAGALLSEFASSLHSAGLEIAPTTADRQWFTTQKGILGVKGTGALQADALVVAIDPNAVDAEALISDAEARGLIFLGSASSTEAPIYCELADEERLR